MCRRKNNHRQRNEGEKNDAKKRGWLQEKRNLLFKSFLPRLRSMSRHKKKYCRVVKLVVAISREKKEREKKHSYVQTPPKRIMG